MSIEEDILPSVLNGLKNIRELVTNTRNIEAALEDFKLGKTDDAVQLIECTKKLLEDIYISSCKIREEFNEKVCQREHSDKLSDQNLLNDNLENISNQNDAQIENSVNVSTRNGKEKVDEVISKEPKGKSKGIKVRISNRNKVENISDKANSDDDRDNDQECNEDKNSENYKNSKYENKSNKDTNDLEENDNSKLQSSDMIDSSVIENDPEDKNNSKEQNKENIDMPNEVPKIRLVDLEKLIDPRIKKSVKFDSSVIILTSSDEENSTPKKIINDRENGVLKSALKKKTKVEKIEPCLIESHSDRQSPSKKSSKRNRDKDSSSDNSESEKETKETDRKKIKLKIKLNPLSAVTNNERRDSVSEDSDADSRFRKSSRLKNKAKETLKRCESLNQKFEKTRIARKKVRTRHKQNIEKLSDTSSLSDEDESDYEDTSRNNKKSKNENEKSSSDEEIEEHSKKKKFQKTKENNIPMDVDDEMFNYEVYIPLPKIECDELKDIYLHNKEILEIKRLTNLKTLQKKSSKKKQKSTSQSQSADVSDTKEKQKNKSRSDKHQSSATEANDNASDKEELTTENLEASKDKSDEADISTSDKDDESNEPVNFEVGEKDPLTADDQIADIAMTYINDLQENDETDSEIINSEEKKKSNKSKKSEAESKDMDEENKQDDKDECENSENGNVSDYSKSDGDLDENNFNTDTEESKKLKDKTREDKEEDSVNKEKMNEDSESENNSSTDIEKNKKCQDKATNSDDTDKEDDSIAEQKEKENSDLTDDKKSNLEKENNDSDTAKEDNKIDDKKSDTDDSDVEINGLKKKDWKKNKLLTEKLDSSDSDDNFGKFSKKKDAASKQLKTDSKKKTETASKRKLKKSSAVISDSDESVQGSASDSNKEKESSTSDSEKEETKKKPARKRIKRVRSSSSEEDKSTRKHIRRLIDRDSLSETTKQAEAAEKERKARISEKQKKYNSIFDEKMDATIDKIVLEYDEKDEKKELLTVDKKLVDKLKPHQANGIRFMWDACFENLKRAKKEQGSGCILAHCMGLGKTLQVIALTHTLLKNTEKTGVAKVLIVCPVNTVLNWKAEFKKWLPRNNTFEIYELVNCKQNYERQYRVNEWHEEGGVLIIGYTMFRNLSSPDNKRLSKKMREVFAKGFVDPGPDLVICDEGHLLKNEKTHLSIAMNRIKTLRRIVLTGTPLQNNLKEYWCMVQFIKPNLLGTYKEYLNRFANPITNGQYTDSTQHDIMVMRKRSHVLHKLLDGVVQRRDYSVLEPYLPPKHEYVLFVKLSPVQINLYKHYIEKYARKGDGSNRTSFLFTDFQQLQRICTHPRVLGDKSSDKREKLNDEDEDSEGSLRDFVVDNDESSDSSSSSSSSGSDSSDSGDSQKETKKKKKEGRPAKTRVTRAQAALRRDNDEESDPEITEIRKEWWQEFCDGAELDNINNSGKLKLLFQILKECEEIGDKVLIFSQSLLTLNCIEYFLDKIDETTQTGNSEAVGGFKGSWSIGLDYFRLDGSSSCENRATWCDLFNNPNNTRARLFLISTKAGGLGINLVAANRVIIFDVSWNPSHDIQSIYRVYRFGQTKPCYIYRFVTLGAMEMKLYERQVTKQAISKRVLDEQQIDRHYNQNDLQELYQCDLEPEDRPIPLVPKDVLLGEMLQKHSDVIFKYHIHQSLLENKEEEGLNEEERKAAWEEFENEKVLRKTNTYYTYGGLNLNAGVTNVNPQLIANALRNIVKHDNPTWSEVQINGIIPALVQQLQTQLSENDTSMYSRVTQEIQRMQIQKAREIHYQKQLLAMQQRQQAMWNNGVDNYFLDPAQVRNMVYMNNAGMPYNRLNQAGPSVSNEVIDLND